MEYQIDSCNNEGGMLNRGPKCANVHPLEESLKTLKERQEKADIQMASRTFGIGFALHMRHERAATSCPQIGHLGFLKRHDVMHQSLTGRDLDFDFGDMLALEPEHNQSIHKVMDNSNSKSFFKR